jgi:hypothetical protein
VEEALEYGLQVAKRKTPQTAPPPPQKKLKKFAWEEELELSDSEEDQDQYQKDHNEQANGEGTSDKESGSNHPTPSDPIPAVDPSNKDSSSNVQHEEEVTRIDLEQFSSAKELEQFGLDGLKRELQVGSPSHSYQLITYSS